jgi:hypothetical protein
LIDRIKGFEVKGAKVSLSEKLDAFLLPALETPKDEAVVIESHLPPAYVIQQAWERLERTFFSLEKRPLTSAAFYARNPIYSERVRVVLELLLAPPLAWATLHRRQAAARFTA